MKRTTMAGRRRPTAVRAAWLFDSVSAALRADPVIVLNGPAITAVGYGIAPRLSISDLRGSFQEGGRRWAAQTRMPTGTWPAGTTGSSGE